MSGADLLAAFGGLDLSTLLKDESAATEETALAAVSRNIAGDLVEVLALSGAQLLSGRDEAKVLEQLDQGLASLRRLALASEEQEHIDLLAELSLAHTRYQQQKGRSGPRHTFLNVLRDWLPKYGRFLGGESEARLTRLVEFDESEVPLFVELAQLRGIGPRRLRRLHGAGFYQAARLSATTPQELAAVTGLPMSLAGQVISHSKEWEESQRRKAIVDMKRRLREFQAAVQGLQASDQSELMSAATDAMRQMRSILSTMENK